MREAQKRIYLIILFTNFNYEVLCANSQMYILQICDSVHSMTQSYLCVIIRKMTSCYAFLYGKWLVVMHHNADWEEMHIRNSTKPEFSQSINIRN